MKLVKGHKYLRRGNDVVPYSQDLMKAAGGDWSIFIPTDDIVTGEQDIANQSKKPAPPKDPKKTAAEAEDDAKNIVAKKVEKVPQADLRTEMAADLGTTIQREPEPAGGLKKVQVGGTLDELTS